MVLPMRAASVVILPSDSSNWSRQKGNQRAFSSLTVWDSSTSTTKSYYPYNMDNLNNLSSHRAKHIFRVIKSRMMKRCKKRCQNNVVVVITSNTKHPEYGSKRQKWKNIYEEILDLNICRKIKSECNSAVIDSKVFRPMFLTTWLQ